MESDSEASLGSQEGNIFVCDECGVRGQGLCYHSTRIICYDLCKECYEQNHRHLKLADSFVATDEYQDFKEETYFENPESLKAEVMGHEDLDHELQQKPDLQYLHYWADPDVDAAPPARESYKRVANYISRSSTLKLMRLRLYPHDQFRQSYQAILQAVSENRSILTLHVMLDCWCQHTVLDLCDIVQTNKSIRNLIVRHKHRARDGTRNFIRSQETARDSAAWLLRSLVTTKCSLLRSFAFQSIYELGDNCYEITIRAMKNCPNLKRIKATFCTEQDTTELNQLMQNKQQKWMNDWTDVGATNQSRLKVLEEILECKDVEERDQIPALFHFIRSHPGSLPELKGSTEGSTKKRKRSQVESN